MIYLVFFSQRLNIIKGAYEPTEAEAKCAFDGDEVGEAPTFQCIAMVSFRLMKRLRKQKERVKNLTNRKKKKVTKTFVQWLFSHDLEWMRRLLYRKVSVAFHALGFVFG